MTNFTTETSIETAASPRQIWRLFADVNGWKEWNAGIESIAIHGPFASGTTFTMKPPGMDALESTLRDVEEDVGFTDETRVGPLVVTVSHRIEKLAAGSRVVYSLEAAGPEADQIGPAIASDFGDVLAALVARAEERTDGR